MKTLRWVLVVLVASLVVVYASVATTALATVVDYGVRVADWFRLFSFPTWWDEQGVIGKIVFFVGAVFISAFLSLLGVCFEVDRLSKLSGSDSDEAERKNKKDGVV